MRTKIPGRELASQLLIRFFTGAISRTIINTSIPIILSVYSLYYNEKVELHWYFPIVLLSMVILIHNIVAEILLRKERKDLKYWDLLEESYRSHCNLNRRSAAKIFRLNKIIKKQLEKGQPVDIMVFDKMADFHTISFDVCNSIYNMIVNKFGVDTKCEVTIYQAVDNGVSMVAYANENNETPLSYKRRYTKNYQKYLFGKIFKDLNAQIFVCVNQQEVRDNFKWLHGSEVREQKICQYIGIPLLTERKKIELLLQIDVSKPNVFGKNREEMMKYAKHIFQPYMMLLNKTYERDLIFNGYYDIIAQTLALNESVGINENN